MCFNFLPLGVMNNMFGTPMPPYARARALYFFVTPLLSVNVDTDCDKRFRLGDDGGIGERRTLHLDAGSAPVGHEINQQRFILFLGNDDPRIQIRHLDDFAAALREDREAAKKHGKASRLD
jgi:hypothetical protein